MWLEQKAGSQAIRHQPEHPLRQTEKVPDRKAHQALEIHGDAVAFVELL